MSGLGGQLVLVAPAEQMVMVVSTYVDLATYRALVGPDDVRRLYTAVLRALKGR